MADWDPAAYLKFKDERTQPSMDLVARIKLSSPGNIIDIGCGPGNSTQILVDRWPQAQVTGLDNSKSMIEKAQADFPQQTWIVADAAKLDPSRKYDLVFSNATIQWIPGHERLISEFLGQVNDGGALAVQVPLFNRMPMSQAIKAVADAPQWRKYAGDCEKHFTYHDAGFYYDILGRLTGKIELWETSYVHILASQQALLEFIRSTGLRPYLASLPSEEARQEFEQEVLAECGKVYPVHADGKVLFPFKRLFFIGYK